MGHAPIAPGTFGAMVGVLFFVLLTYLGWELYLLTVVTLSCLWVWAADRAELLMDRAAALMEEEAQE